MNEISESPVDPQEKIVTDEQAIKAYQDLGFSEIKSRDVVALREMGLHVRQSGILRQQCGTALFNQQTLMEAMNLVKVVLDYHSKIRHKKDTSHKAKVPALQLAKMDHLTKMLCSLSAKLSESQEVMIKLSGGPGHGTVGVIPDKFQRSFVPGSEVRPGGTLVVAQNVQINGGEKAKAS